MKLVIKHDKFMDICCQVLDIEEFAEYFRLEVEWINQGYKESWIVPCHTPTNTQWIEIKKADVGQWQVCTEQDPVCYRNAGWKQLQSLSIENEA